MKKNDGPNVRFFRSAEHLRAWFEKHHDTATELWIGYYKKSSGKPTVTYSESLDEALCFGWIDGIRKRIDEVSFTNRFSPRRAISKWSLVNIRRVKALTAEGRMRPAGLKAFETRRANKSGIYSYENRPEQLDEPYQSLLRKHPAAWEFFQSRPPYQRRSVCWWILSAKQEATRLRRLQHLIDAATSGRSIDPMAPAASRKPRAD